MQDIKQSASARILWALAKQRGLGIKSLRTEVGGSFSTIVSRVRELERGGYLSRVRGRSIHPDRIELTEKGKEVAALLKRIERA